MSVFGPIGAQAHCERGQRINVSGAVSGSWVSVSEYRIPRLVALAWTQVFL